MAYEKIQVYARSAGGKVTPLQFLWRHRKFDVRDILEQKRRSYRKKIYYYFRVTTLPQGEFELEFDLKRGQWFLLSSKLPANGTMS